MEEWRDVPGYEGRFQASSLGRIRSLLVLEGHTKSTGYQAIGQRYKSTEYVHALVAAAFIGPRPVGFEINHKDGVKRNNVPENLEYVTRKRNHHHAYEIGLIRHSLTAEQMDEVSDLYFTQGKSIMEIARGLNVKNALSSRVKMVRSVIGIWRAGDRKGRTNPYEFKLTVDSAYQLIRMYKAGGVTQKQVARAFNIDPSHASRVISGQIHPDALRKYQEEEPC